MGQCGGQLGGIKEEGRGPIRERVYKHHVAAGLRGGTWKTQLTPPGYNMRGVESALRFGAAVSHAFNLVLHTQCPEEGLHHKAASGVEVLRTSQSQDLGLSLPRGRAKEDTSLLP